MAASKHDLLGKIVLYRGRLFYIKVNSIKFFLRIEDYDRTYYVEDGNWDLRKVPCTIHSTVLDLFIRGKSFRETEQYKHMLEGLRLGKYEVCSGCRTESEVDDYFAKLIQTFEDIKKNGYKTQKELGNKGQNEIHILIDRNGQFIQTGGGTHRLSMAKLLNIEYVPIKITKIHYRWFANQKRLGLNIFSNRTEFRTKYYS